MKKKLFTLLLTLIMCLSLLPMTVLATEPTAGSTASALPVVTVGSYGEEVKLMQTRLNELGFDCGAVDGRFGAKTLAAVKAYQAAKGLTADGKVGPLTWGSMSIASSGSHHRSNPTPPADNRTFKAVLDGTDMENITLTFYYDESSHGTNGESILLFDELPTAATEYEDWEYHGYSSFIRRVVINSSVKNYTGLTSTAFMFCNLTAADSITGAENLNVSNVTDMSDMFRGFGKNCAALNTVPDVSEWDTSCAEDMSCMFYEYGGYIDDDEYAYHGSAALNDIPDVSDWDTSKVTNMDSMFYEYGYSSAVLNAVPDVSHWDTSEMEYMNYLFSYYGCASAVLSSVPVVSGWDTSKVRTMYVMFSYYGYNSTVLDFTLDLSGWNVERVGTGEYNYAAYSYDSMFGHAGYYAQTWSVTIPAATGEKANDSEHWYLSNGTGAITPCGGQHFTVAGN